MENPLQIIVLPDHLAICRLPPDSPDPAWADGSNLIARVRTPDELSIVCGSDRVPEGVQADSAWRALKVQGPLDLTLVGILSSLSFSLAAAGVGIFVVSTYDTDYLLVKENDLENAIRALREARHEVYDLT